MARTANKRKLVEELYTLGDADLIEGVANLVIENKFTVTDVFKYLGRKKHDLVNGYLLVPFNEKYFNIMIDYLVDDKDTITRFTLGGGIQYTLSNLIQKFGDYTVAYNPRDEETVFFFKQLPKEVNAVELQFSRYDLIYDKTTKEIYQIIQGKKSVLTEKNIGFEHFTLLF